MATLPSAEFLNFQMTCAIWLHCLENHFWGMRGDDTFCELGAIRPAPMSSFSDTNTAGLDYRFQGKLIPPPTPSACCPVLLEVPKPYSALRPVIALIQILILLGESGGL